MYLSLSRPGSSLHKNLKVCKECNPEVILASLRNLPVSVFKGLCSNIILSCCCPIIHEPPLLPFCQSFPCFAAWHPGRGDNTKGASVSQSQNDKPRPSLTPKRTPPAKNPVSKCGEDYGGLPPIHETGRSKATRKSVGETEELKDSKNPICPSTLQPMCAHFPIR